LTKISAAALYRRLSRETSRERNFGAAPQLGTEMPNNILSQLQDGVSRLQALIVSVPESRALRWDD
jgi:hypothetical protein